MANFIGKITVSDTTPKTLKQLLLEAIDLRFAGKTAAEKSRYLADFTKWTTDETFLNPQGSDITVCDNYLAIPDTSLAGFGTNVTAANMATFGTVIADGTSKHYQKGLSLHSMLVISAVAGFTLDVDFMIGEL